MRKAMDILRMPSLALLALVASSLPCWSESGAKDLFYRQLRKPSEVLNTGVQYWFELKRGEKVTNVSNKFAFKSGDSFRIHVKSNADAFTYVILREGSSGEQSILFPDSRFHDNNQLKSSTEYSIPQDGYLKFDQHPGTEKVILLLSRHQLDPQKYLADKTKRHVVIAALREGAKDLVPGTVVLAYSNTDSSNIVDLPSDKIDKLQNSDSSNEKHPKPKENTATLASSNADNAVTTLVQKDPAEVLAIDLDLVHEP